MKELHEVGRLQDSLVDANQMSAEFASIWHRDKRDRDVILENKITIVVTSKTVLLLNVFKTPCQLVKAANRRRNAYRHVSGTTKLRNVIDCHIWQLAAE
jgi:hypothetical protein